MILHFLAGIIVSSHLSDSLYHWLLLTSFEILLGKNWQVDLHCSLHKFKKAVVSHISESKCDRQTNAWRWIMFMVLIMKAQDILRKKFQAKFRTQPAFNDLSWWIKESRFVFWELRYPNLSKKFPCLKRSKFPKKRSKIETCLAVIVNSVITSLYNRWLLQSWGPEQLQRRVDGIGLFHLTWRTFSI